MGHAIEWFVALTSLTVGASHVVQAGAWVEVYDRLHRQGRPGAFINGGLSLAVGAAVVAGHGAWSWPGGVLTAFGWLSVLKGAICFIAPDAGLRSMARAPSPVALQGRRRGLDGDRRVGRMLPLARRAFGLTRRGPTGGPRCHSPGGGSNSPPARVPSAFQTAGWIVSVTKWTEPSA